MAGLKEAEPDLYKSIDAALVTIAANGAAASAQAESAAKAAAAAEAAGGAGAPSGMGGPSLTPSKTREGNAAGFPTHMPATPANPNMLFSTINAETLETSAQNVSFPVPEDKVCGGGATTGTGMQLLVRVSPHHAHSANSSLLTLLTSSTTLPAHALPHDSAAATPHAWAALTHAALPPPTCLPFPGCRPLTAFTSSSTTSR